MKFNLRVTSSQRKNRKAHFTAPSSDHERTSLLRTPAKVPRPVDSGGEKTTKSKWYRGSFKGRQGKIVKVYRRKWVIHVEGITREKVNGTMVNVGVNASKVVIAKLKLDKDRKSLLERKAKGREVADKEKGTKFTAEDVMQNVN